MQPTMCLLMEGALLEDKCLRIFFYFIFYSLLIHFLKETLLIFNQLCLIVGSSSCTSLFKTVDCGKSVTCLPLCFDSRGLEGGQEQWQWPLKATSSMQSGRRTTTREPEAPLLRFLWSSSNNFKHICAFLQHRQTSSVENKKVYE